MARTDREAVRGVIDTDAPDNVIDGFIEDAALELNERVNAANVGYSEGRMAKLEKYLSAHLVRFLWDRQETRSSVADVTFEYSGAFGESLTATSAGQVFIDTDTADVFDPTFTDDAPDESGRFVKRDGFTGTAHRSTERVEGTERPLRDGEFYRGP